MTKPWAMAPAIAWPKRHQITRGRKLPGGRFEGISAVYDGGKLLAEATHIDETRAQAVRVAARLARRLAP